MKKSTQRICKFCKELFTIPKYLPYYSCQHCRKKEEHERLLVHKECKLCGKLISTSAQTLICKTCSATLKNSNYERYTCENCNNEFVRVGEETKCNHCRKKEIVDAHSNVCMFCNINTHKTKVCAACKSLGLQHPRKICLQCKTIFVAESKNWEENAFCSESCKHEWNAAHSHPRSTNRTKAQLEEQIKHVLLINPNSTTKDITAEIGINPGALSRKHICISDIRKDLNLPNLKYKGSLFEDDVYKILIELGLEVHREKTYNDLKYTRYLRYDFFIPSLNLLIEADGQQHYEEIDPWGTRHKIVLRDRIKNKYAFENSINLLRVQYFRYYNKLKVENFKTLIKDIQCRYYETGSVKLFNCWNGSELIPISSEACSLEQERSTTIPEGSTDEANASGNGSYPNK